MLKMLMESNTGVRALKHMSLKQRQNKLECMALTSQVKPTTANCKQTF
jgi:hypothetical protein